MRVSASGPTGSARSPGTQAFGRFDPEDVVCETAVNAVTLSAADYSLQLSDPVSRAVAGPASFGTRRRHRCRLIRTDWRGPGTEAANRVPGGTLNPDRVTRPPRGCTMGTIGRAQ
jgi:hypothetical protein